MPSGKLEIHFQIRPETLRWIFLGANLLLLFFLLFVALVDPNKVHYTFCPIRWKTGLFCATCGSTRAAHELLNLNFASAVAYNPFFVFFLCPVFAACWGLLALKIFFGKALRLPYKTFAAALILLALAFMITRNLPGENFDRLRPHLLPADKLSGGRRSIEEKSPERQQKPAAAKGKEAFLPHHAS